MKRKKENQENSVTEATENKRFLEETISNAVEKPSKPD